MIIVLSAQCSVLRYLSAVHIIRKRFYILAFESKLTFSKAAECPNCTSFTGERTLITVGSMKHSVRFYAKTPQQTSKYHRDIGGMRYILFSSKKQLEEKLHECLSTQYTFFKSMECFSYHSSPIIAERQLHEPSTFKTNSLECCPTFL